MITEIKIYAHVFFIFCRNIMSNKVFYQHPNLMRALGMHETVMEVMVNVLGGGDSKVFIFFYFYKCVLSKDSPCFKMQISNKIKHSYKLFCF